MSGTTPPPGSGPGDQENPYAQSGQGRPPEQPWQSAPPPSGPPAWTGPVDGGSAWGDPAVPAEPPPSISRAVILMYVGAAISAVTALIPLLFRGSIRDAIEESDTSLTADEVDAAVNVTVGVGLVVGLIGVALWLWMASANKAGKSWARVVATVLGGLNILFTVLSLSTGGGGIALIVNLISIGLAGYILYLLYRPESSQYYAARSGKQR
ncbi:hypothetical protein E1212_17090 [Jiangella ureilytica]|uniref:Uncharacterized protein n=1 Tax=Jiangella ureilytica TaxID=2530374 RepID=A0A4R4RJR3_9ACTN|nr:hypothetical protein [Jiangella ureilytica]TDC49841.1 hypothetical protein E1212_17090 [Jiangella ureilytica]